MRRVRRGLSCGRDRDDAMTEVHPIEVESYRIMRSRIDLSTLPPLTRAVTERIIHATADFDFVTDLVCDEMALAAGVEALRRDAPVIADVAMVASGITGYPVICKIGDSLSARLARTAHITLSAAAVRLAHREARPAGPRSGPGKSSPPWSSASRSGSSALRTPRTACGPAACRR